MTKISAIAAWSPQPSVLVREAAMLRLVSGVAVVLMSIVLTTSAQSSNGFSAADFGATGDGKADDTEAIQQALDAAGPSGGVVHLPAGSYLLSASLRVPPAVTLIGEGARWENSATRLIVPVKGFPAVRLGNASGIKGLAIAYPNNRDNANPQEYPPAIQLEGINPSVESIVFDCAWIGIATAPGGCNAGQGMFRDLTGFVHHVGMHLSGCRDVNRIVDVHWFVGGRDSDLPSHYRQQRVGFEFGDVDGVLMERCFMIGGKTFLHQKRYKDTPDGRLETAHSLGFQINQCWVEDVDEGFVFEGMCGFVLNSTNILVRKGGVGVRVIPDSLYYNGVISGVQVRSFTGPIIGFEFNPLKPHPRNRLSIGDCQVTDGVPAVHLMSGARRVNVHDCHLQGVEGKPAIQIDPGADLFTVTNNVLLGPNPIADESAPDARKTISGNLCE
jgi:hypothetical protein